MTQQHDTIPQSIEIVQSLTVRQLNSLVPLLLHKLNGKEEELEAAKTAGKLLSLKTIAQMWDMSEQSARKHMEAYGKFLKMKKVVFADERSVRYHYDDVMRVQRELEKKM